MDTKKIIIIAAQILRGTGLMAPFVLEELIKALSNSEKSKQILEQKIDKAYQSMKETSQLISEIETEIENYNGQLEKVKESYNKYSALSSIEQEKARGILEHVDSMSKKSRWSNAKDAFLISLVTGVIFFFIGKYFG